MVVGVGGANPTQLLDERSCDTEFFFFAFLFFQNIAVTLLTNGDLLPAALGLSTAAHCEKVSQAKRPRLCTAWRWIFPFCPLRKLEALSRSLSLPPVICYENLDHKQREGG